MKCFACGSKDSLVEININSEFVKVKCPNCEQVMVMSIDSYNEMELVERIANRVVEKLNEARRTQVLWEGL